MNGSLLQRHGSLTESHGSLVQWHASLSERHGSLSQMNGSLSERHAEGGGGEKRQEEVECGAVGVLVKPSSNSQVLKRSHV